MKLKYCHTLSVRQVPRSSASSIESTSIGHKSPEYLKVRFLFAYVVIIKRMKRHQLIFNSRLKLTSASTCLPVHLLAYECGARMNLFLKRNIAGGQDQEQIHECFSQT